MGSGQSVTDAATVVGAAAGVGSLALALFYPVIAVQINMIVTAIDIMYYENFAKSGKS